MVRSTRKAGFLFSLALFIAIAATMCITLLVFKSQLQTGLFLSWVVTIPALMYLGFSFKELEEYAYDMIRKIMQPICIIVVVGAMIGTWIVAGTVPTMIYAGLKLINPRYFLVTTLLLCSVVALFTGTSWGTMGTAGVAMVGVGVGLGIPVGMTAGAVISGAYFGDKMSPVSDTTNLAPAVSGSNIFDHIRHMMWTTTPAYVITIILFLLIGMKYGSDSADISLVNNICLKLEETYNLGLICMIPAIVVLVLLVMKKEPLPVLIIGAVLGLIISIFYQGNNLPLLAQIKIALGAVYTGAKSNTGVRELDILLNRGGIKSMYDILGTYIFALGLGGMLQGSGVLEALLKSFIGRIKSVGSLVFSTMVITYISDMVGSTLSFAIVITGTLMKPVFRQFKLKPENLSRILEDCGTMGAALIPWNTGAVYAATVMNVSPIEFIPYCFLNWTTPLISLIYGITGFTMTRYSDEELAQMDSEKV